MHILRLLRKRGWRGTLLGILCAGVAWLATHTAMLLSVEEWLQDGCFAFRGQRSTRARVLIVGLDEETLDGLKKPLLYTSPELAEVVAYFKAKGAAAIGLDVFVPQSYTALPDLQEGKPGDVTKLGQAILDAGNVVLPEWDLGGRRLRPVLQWQLKHLTEPGPTDIGFVNLTEDGDHFLRRQQLYARDPETGLGHPQFALALAALGRGWKFDWTKAGLSLEGDRVPLDDEQKLRINFVGPPGTFTVLSLKNALAAARGEKALGDEADPRGAIVIIGTTARSQQDYHTTPYSNTYWGGLYGRHTDLMSGAEIHANIAATLLDRAYIYSPPWPVHLLILVGAGALLGRVYAKLNLAGGLAVAVLHHFGWKFLCLGTFALLSLRLEIVPMLVLGGLLYGTTFLQRWWTLRRMVGMINSEKVIALLEDDPGALDRRGEDRVVTVLFADIRGFSTYSENHAAHEVVALLNAYFSAVVPVVERHGGMLNQYVGDGMMVIFGSPVAQDDHAARAVRAAAEMVRLVDELRERWAQLDFPGFRIGVGVHTGRAVLGMVGSPNRLDYTAIGDTTNTAARIEAKTRDLDVDILISRATYLDVPRDERTSLGCEARAQQVEVKGKAQKIDVHAVGAALPSSTFATPTEVTRTLHPSSVQEGVKPVLKTGAGTTTGESPVLLGRAPTKEPPRKLIGKSRKPGDCLQCAVFAPPELARETTSLIQVFAFLVGQAEEATIMALEFDDTAARRGITTLHVAVRRGQQLMFHLTLPSLCVAKPEAGLVWNGVTSSVQFEVAVPRECRPQDIVGNLVVSIDEAPVGQILFKVRIIDVPSQRDASVVSLAVDHQSSRFRKAFISYSSKDREKVELALGMLALVEIDYFQDVKDLRPGHPWREQLERQIDECDLFLLFWSSNARDSNEVRTEIRRAVQRLGPAGEPPPVIWPYVIEGPPYPEVPPELNRIHFGSYRHLRTSAVRAGTPTPSQAASPRGITTLDSNDDAGSRATAPAGEPVTVTWEKKSVDGQPELIGHYRILGELGKGGMGVVYRAEDARLRRVVALKVVRRELAADPLARARFLREARAAAAVENDHIVPIYEADETPEGTLYLAMPYLQGQTLQARLQAPDELTIAQATRIGGDIAAGLAAAHARGLIHRDVKPANIWLEQRTGAGNDEPGRAKLLDFGLARVEGSAELSLPGTIVGTPSYMSPEQARGGDLDARSDLFSMGTVLYRLVTGRMPFTGESTIAILRAIEEHEPLRVHELRPEAPGELSLLIGELLAKRPEDRPASAKEVHVRLKDISLRR